MLKKTLLSILLMAAVSNAAVKELIPQLKSDNTAVQTQARLGLLAICSKASAPDAAAGGRKAVSLEICEVLAAKPSVVEVALPLIQSLERVGGEEAVPTLSKLLAHKDENVRDAARRALVANPSPKAGQALAAQLKMRKARDPVDIAGCITALGERKDPGASNLIAGYANHKDERIFLAAVKALGRLNEDAGVKALAKQRQKEKGFRKVQIDAALFAMDRTIVFEKLYGAKEDEDVRAVALLGLLLSGKTELAAAAMVSGEPSRQVAVIEAAIQGKDAGVLDAVAANLGSLSPLLQLQALNALESGESRACAPAAEPLLKSGDLIIQDAAASTLARIGTAESVAPLIANGRPAAKRALGMLNVEGVDAMLERIAAEAPDAKARAVAVEALASRGRKDLIPTFFRYGAEDDRTVASAAVQAIGRIGDVSNVEALTELMIAREASPVSRDALKAIVEITRSSTEASAAVDVLVEKMEEASPRSQSNLLKALAQTGRAEAFAPLKKACFSADGQLQKIAVKALAGWPTLNGVPVMLEVATDEATSDTNHVILMRGVSRLFANEPKWSLKKAQLQPAIDSCRRDEERAALESTRDHLKN